MLTPETTLSIKLARTLWYNTYRGRVTDASGEYLATVRLIPTLPLDRAELPPDAPEADSYLIVLVEDGTFEAADLTEFESKLSDLLLVQMAQNGFAAEYCQFAYPSPPYTLAGNSNDPV
ncbi:MAG: hypothetical protein P4N41_05800 [Negativicutes bacterium]|nr:hypothetical protein [Negativicutes bacterium]